MKTVFVIDDQPAICEAVAEKLERDAAKNEMEPLTAVPLFSLNELELRLANGTPPDLVLLDLGLRESRGLATLTRVAEIQRRAQTEAPVAIFSGADFDSREGIDLARTAMNEHGVRGILPKTVEPNRMFIGLGRMLGGETWLPEELIRGLFSFKPSNRSGLDELTPRERDVARGIAEGLPSKVIAARLNLSYGHVRQVVGQILLKLGLDNRTEVALFVRENDHPL
jgi:two-component system nitrate/nitrite response regulator NarL